MSDAPAIPGPLEDWRILLVEDDPLISLDLETSLSELGAIVTATPRIASALAIVGASRLDYAILDFELGAETSEPIAAAAQAAGLPFLFLSGHSAHDERFAPWPGVPVLVKPISATTLARHIQEALGNDPRAG